MILRYNMNNLIIYKLYFKSWKLLIIKGAQLLCNFSTKDEFARWNKFQNFCKIIFNKKQKYRKWKEKKATDDNNHEADDSDIEDSQERITHNDGKQV